MTLENNIMPYAVVNVVLSISQRSSLLNSLGFEFVVHSSLTLTGPLRPRSGLYSFKNTVNIAIASSSDDPNHTIYQLTFCQQLAH
jgi:hypothetical protein